MVRNLAIGWFIWYGNLLRPSDSCTRTDRGMAALADLVAADPGAGKAAKPKRAKPKRASGGKYQNSESRTWFKSNKANGFAFLSNFWPDVSTTARRCAAQSLRRGCVCVCLCVPVPVCACACVRWLIAHV